MEYIINRENGMLHFYFDKKNGLMMSSGNNFPPEQIKKNIKENFCVYERENAIHIICINEKNEIIYIHMSGEEKKEFTLCELKGDFHIKHIAVADSKDRMNLLYSAEYGGDILLVHCVLGNHAKPSVIDKLKNSGFFTFDGKVYYTNQNGILGYQELADGKPDRFIAVKEGAEDVYLYEYENKEYIVYRIGNTIFVNHIPKIDDTDVKLPVIAKKNNTLALMWQSAEIIKFTDVDGLKPPKRLLSTGRQDLCSVQEKDGIYYDYCLPAGNGFEAEDSRGDELKNVVDLILGIKEEIKEIEEKIRKLSIG